jgi:hypothetical protein
MTVPIPEYPDSRTVAIRDRSLLQEHFKTLQPTVSELSFANLFLFRHLHQYMLANVNNSLTVFGCGYDGKPYFLPPLSGERGEAARRLLDEGRTLYGADEKFVAEHLRESRYKLSPDRDNDDYLYLRSDLAELSGKRFHKKKNRVNYFTSRYNYKVEPFSGTHLRSALQLLEKWQRVNDQDFNRSMSAELAASSEGLELAVELGLSGVVLLTESGVSAFALGEHLNDSTFVCHFEKSDPFMEGAAQLVNREFCRFLPAGYVYVNREQDLGESGLRGAKNSYHPVEMIRKFRVSLQSQTIAE